MAPFWVLDMTFAKTHMQKLEPFTEITKAKAKASPTVPPIPARDADEAATVPGNNVAFLDVCFHAYIVLYYMWGHNYADVFA